MPFDFLHYFQADPAFVRLWREYGFVEKSGYYSIYVHRDPRPRVDAAGVLR